MPSCSEIVENGMKKYFERDNITTEDIKTYVDEYIKIGNHENYEFISQTICLIEYLESNEKSDLVTKIKTINQQLLQQPLLHRIFRTLDFDVSVLDEKDAENYKTTYSYVDGDPNKPVHTDKDINALILNKKDEINKRDKDGNTPLMLACETDMLGTFIMPLLKNGANLFLRNNNEQNAIMVAASKNNYIYLFVMIYIVKNCESSAEIKYDIDVFIQTFLDFLKDKKEIGKKDGDVFARFKQKLLPMKQKRLIAIIDNLKERIKNATNSYRNLCAKNPNYSFHANNFMPPPIDDADNEGNTAFMITALGSYWFLSEILIIMGCDINLRNLNGETALMIACKNNNLIFVEKLYTFLKGEQKLHTLDVGIKNREGKNAYELCKTERIKEILTDEPYHSIILDPNLNVIRGDANMGFLILESAIKYGGANVKLIDEICLKNEIDDTIDTIDKKGNNILMLACKHGNKGVVEIVIRKIDEFASNTAKAWDARRKQEFFFRSNKEYKCCLHLATESGNLELVKYLLDLECFKDENLQKTHNPKNNTETISTFARAFPGDLRFKDVDGPAIFANVKFNPSRTASLHLAAKHGYVEIAKCLIEYGCDFIIGKMPGRVNPIHDAAKNGHVQIVDILLQAGANLTFAVGGETSMEMAQSEKKKLELILTEFVSENDQFKKIKEQIKKLKEVECIFELCKYIIEGNATDFEKKFREKSNTKVEPQASTVEAHALTGEPHALTGEPQALTEQIVKYDLDPNTFLRVACFNYKKDIMELLITKFKANLTHQNLVGETLLHWAMANNKNKEAMYEFLTSKSTLLLSITNNKGETPLDIIPSLASGGSLNKTRKLFKKKTRKNKKSKRFQRKSRKPFRKH